MQGEHRIRRLRWLCRRGMKELDLLLEPFVEKHEDLLARGGMPDFERFLEHEDDLIWDWLQKARVPEDPELRALIADIRGDA
jgi:antitoxin CptB